MYYRRLTSLCYNQIMLCFIMKLKQGKLCVNNDSTFCIFLLIIRVRLSKRRARANSLQTCLLVKHRELTEDEAFAQVCII